MIMIEQTLRAEHVLLPLSASTPDAAIGCLIALLKTDPRVLDWESLAKGMRRSAPCFAERDGEFALCIPHVRTEAVNAMIMGAGRLEPALLFAGSEKPVRYLFLFAIPHPLAADYLRIAGLLARLAKDSAGEEQLRAARTGAEFVETLSRLEAKL